MKNTNISEKANVKSAQVRTGDGVQIKKEIAADGPLSFVKSWFTAVSGI